MEKKFRMTPRELILNSKDYSNYTKNELIYQYDNFKKEMTTNLRLRDTRPNLINIKMEILYAFPLQLLFQCLSY